MFEDQKFTLTEDHVKLLRHAYIGWEDCEYGAPAIDCKRPYGNSDVEGDIHEILTGERMPGHWDHLPKELSEKYAAIHKETRTALQVVLHTGAFEPGEYVAEAYTRDWRLVARMEASP